MPLSKVKSTKQRARLNGRIDAWERMPATAKTGKSGKPSYTKPGSNKK
jgi:hypothetical protein